VRVQTVVKRYESGLVWIDENSGGVNWMTLHPDVVVNRFPRNANAALKLCGPALAGKSEFDVHYPRAYSATTNAIHMVSFIADYSITACVSLLRAFVDGRHRTMCAKNGQVSTYTRKTNILMFFCLESVYLLIFRFQYGRYIVSKGGKGAYQFSVLRVTFAARSTD